MYQLRSLYDNIEKIEHDKEIEQKEKDLNYNNVIMSIYDYLYYGCSFNDFIKADYDYCKSYTKEELKKIWIDVKNKIGSDY